MVFAVLLLMTSCLPSTETVTGAPALGAMIAGIPRQSVHESGVRGPRLPLRMRRKSVCEIGGMPVHLNR